MKKIKMVLCLIFSFVLIINMMSSFKVVLAAGTIYYVDSVGGIDTNNGTSAATAWKTLTKVNSVTYQPGDKIYFKRGCMWTGMLRPLGSGNSSAQILIDRYGSSGSNPMIDGAGAEAAIKLAAQEYWTIQNLDIKNTNSDPTKSCSGVLIDAVNTSPAVMHRILLKYLNVGNVYGNKSALLNAGIFIKFHSDVVAPFPKFDDLRIESNYIHDIYGSGLVMYGPDNYAHDPNLWSTNVVVKNNTIDRTGLNGALIGMCVNPLVEYNIVANSGALNTQGMLAGCWSFNCKDPKFQFNEVYGTKRFGDDGTAFDTDWGSVGTVIHQYNYTHDNEGGFKIGPFDGGAPHNSPNLVADVVRYNISQNDKNWDCTIQMGSGKSFIYNNTFYNPKYRIYVENRNTTTGNRVYNNIFVGNAGSIYGSACTYDYNSYYGTGNIAPSSDAHKITADPKFALPGSASNGRTTVDGYKLSDVSPCLNAGVAISDNGGRDYWGNTLYNGNPDIGAYERPTGAPVITPSLLPSPTPNPNPTTQTVEAEEGIFGGAAVINTYQTASGLNVVSSLHFNQAYGRVENISGGTSGGSFTLKIRYSCKYNTNLSLYVNGVKVETTAYPLTGTWDTFTDKTTTINLNPGYNTIMVRNDTGTNGISLDKFTIIKN